jgi:acetyltransferase-like isoleucine patch superfamily enzyme
MNRAPEPALPDWPDLPGAASEIWDRSPLPANVVVGEGCRMQRTTETFARFRSRRQPGLSLGREVDLYHWTTFNVEDEGVVTIGDGSVLVGVVFMCAERIAVGRNVVISYNVTVADSDFHPLDPALRRQDAVANAPTGDRARRPPLDTAPVTIEDGAWIGIGAIVLKGVRIGADARIGPGAVITRDVPAGAAATGNPAVIGKPDRQSG